MRTTAFVLASLLAFAAPLASAQAKRAAPGAEMLFVGEFVPPGGHLLSNSGKFVGVMERDGRFCVYEGASPAAKSRVVRCAPHAAQAPGDYFLEVRDDGNLCVGRGAQPPATGGAACFPGAPRPKGQYFAVMMNSGGFELFPGRGWQPASNVAYWTMATQPMPSPLPSLAPPPATAPVPATPPSSVGIWKGQPIAVLKIAMPAEKQVTVLVKSAAGNLPGGTTTCPPGTSPCQMTLPLRSTVSLLAQLKDGYTLKSWGGACAGQVGTCSLTMDRNLDVSLEVAAPATPRQFTLTITPPKDTGTSIAASTPGKSMVCQAGVPACTVPFSAGAQVMLQFTSRVALAFKSWGGACAGQANPCTFVLDRDLAVSVEAAEGAVPPRTLPGFTLTIDPPRAGDAIVYSLSKVGGNECTSDVTRSVCKRQALQAGTVIDFTYMNLTRGTGWSWTGSCAGQQPEVCKLTANQHHKVGVAYTNAPPVQTVTPATAPPPAARTPSNRRYLLAGDSLIVGDTLHSPGHHYFAIQQADGNLCVYRGVPASPISNLWCHHRVGPGPHVTAMQKDGNLCTYRGTPTQYQGGATWCSNAVAAGGQFILRQQDDGNLCVYQGSNPDAPGPVVWCHNTGVNLDTRFPLAIPHPQDYGATIVVANGTGYGMWVTLYNTDVMSPKRGAVEAKCVKTGDEGYFNADALVKPPAAGSNYDIRAELTRTPNCESQPGNAHVVCDIRAQVPAHHPVYSYFVAVARLGPSGGCVWDRQIIKR